MTSTKGILFVVNTPEFSRWIDNDNRVWEKRCFGWKFIGISESKNICDVFSIQSHDCDHPNDIYKEETENNQDYGVKD